nr:hypothetical protein [Tanacetum cinerariifolium]
MANPNPEDPNVPNEDVPEEDPYHLLDYDEEEDPEMDIEEEKPKEDPPGNMNGWVDDNDDVEEEDDENEDVDIEEDDDAEIIFPYEADDELKVEEAGVEPEVEEAVMSLRPRGLMWSWRLRSLMVYRTPLLGLVPKGRLLRDLEALRRHERIREAELGTSRTEVALLGLEARIGKMEKEILHHDLSSLEETLGNVVERLKVLESEENVTLKKKLAEKEMLLDLTRMDRDRAERRLSESIWCNERFYLEIVRKRAFATSMNEFMANMNNGAGGSGRASGSGGT